MQALTYQAPLHETLRALAPIALLPFAFLVFYAFNCLVCIEETRFRDDWFNDGRPKRWLASKATGDIHAMFICTIRWLFVTPHWARIDKDARLWIAVFRTATVVWNVGAIAALTLPAVLQGLR